VEESYEQEQLGAQGQIDELPALADTGLIGDAVTPANEPAAVESPAEQGALDVTVAALFAAEESLHSQPTDLSLIAVGGSAADGSTTTWPSRWRIKIRLPRGRLALLGPFAAVMLIAGVVLTGLGLQGQSVANLLSAPFGASHATATLAPTSVATATPIVSTPAPRPKFVRDRMRELLISALFAKPSSHIAVSKPE
jgi:hypothetical protein